MTLQRLLLAGAIVGTGCGVSDTSVEGSVQGFELETAYAGFVSAKVGESMTSAGTELAMIVISNQPDVCNAQGSLNMEIFEVYDVRPSAKTMAWTVFGQPAIEPGKVVFGVPGFEGASPAPPPESGLFGFPAMNETPSDCAEGGGKLYPDDVELDISSLKAELELLRFDTEASGTFSITQGSQRLEGQFVAQRCDGPFPDPEFVDCP